MIKMVLERVYTVPLRRAFLKAPKWKRSKRAVSALRAFAARHMKSEIVKIDPEVSERVWARGSKRPPARLKLVLKRDDDGIVTVSLPEAEAKKARGKKEEKKKLRIKLPSLRRRKGKKKEAEGKKEEKRKENVREKKKEKKVEAKKPAEEEGKKG